MISSVACKVLILYSVWMQASGLFYHMPSSLPIVPPKTTTNITWYFGFSMAYYPYTKSLMVSAPTENNIGVLYECNLNTLDCFEITHDHIERYSSYTHDYWLGATVRAAQDFVVTCAPRFTTTSQDYSKYGTYGRCFYRNDNSSTLHSMHDAKNEQRRRHTTKFEETMDSLGWSLDISPSESITVGGPAMFTGRALSYKRITSQPLFLQNGDDKKNSDLFNGARFNFGYSVASGYFIYEDEVAYAVGSPYGQQGFGMVLFYESLEDLTDDFIRMSDKMLKTEVVGSMYGAVLCAAQLSETGNDLIVGAPAYAEESEYNIGAVYIYVYKYGMTPVFKKVLKGSSVGGMFGSAIISVGDLNGDGLDEIVVAAPYENQGSVYIYSGADLASDESALTIKNLQKISSAKGSYSPFGLSLAAIGDFDDNGCKELGVAAPTDNVVILFKCFASVTVKLSADFPKMSHTPGNTENYFIVCLNVEYPKKPEKIIANLSTQVTMNHPNAKLTGVGPDGIFTFQVSLEHKQPQYCQNVTYNLPTDGNYDIRVGYNVTSVLVEDPNDLKEFDPSRVVLSDRSEIELSDSILAAACPGGCVPKLTLNYVSSMSTPYKIGTNAIEKYSITNTGDVAYDTCLEVSVEGTFVAHWPTACHKGICSPRRPLKTNEKWEMGDLELEMTGLSNQNRNIKVNVTLFDHCTERGKFKPYNRVIPLFADPKGIEIKGENSINSVIDMTATEMKNQGKQLEHIYKIISDGTVQWVGLVCEFTVEKNDYYKYEAISTEAGNTAPKCQKTDETDKTIKFKCTISKITDKNKIISLVLPIVVGPGIYDDLNDEKNKTLRSNFKLFFDGITKTASVTTTIRLQEGKVPWWVILCAVILGLCLLGLFIMAMRECGLLRRSNKQKLEKLQNSVRRQTMRRSMMQNVNIQSPQDDQLQILENIDE